MKTAAISYPTRHQSLKQLLTTHNTLRTTSFSGVVVALCLSLWRVPKMFHVYREVTLDLTSSRKSPAAACLDDLFSGKTPCFIGGLFSTLPSSGLSLSRHILHPMLNEGVSTSP